MPNGSIEWMKEEFPKLELFFGKIAPVLNRFAEKYNLYIDKYYHQSKSWDFLFRNPKGGVGQIEVWMKDDSHVGISNSWQLCDYNNRRLWDKHTELTSVELDGDKIFSCLEDHLHKVLRWDKSELKKDAEIFDEWSQVSEEEFYKRENSYPFPTIKK